MITVLINNITIINNDNNNNDNNNNDNNNNKNNNRVYFLIFDAASRDFLKHLITLLQCK